MRFHQGVAFLETDQLLDVAKAAERYGFAGMYVSDHLCYPKDLRSPYTYSPFPDRSPIWAPDSDWPDPWCLISAMAAVTEQLTFTTGVYIAPARDLLTVAKLASTAAVISSNRVTLGVGAGWCREEFELTGQDFDNRGPRLDDMIRALRALWQQGWVEYHGTHYDVPALQLNPSPTEPIPIICGGDSPTALRRAARFADGWTCGAMLPADQAMERVQHMHRVLRFEGRDPDAFRIYLTTVDEPDPEGIRRFEDAGVTDWLATPWLVAEQIGDRSFHSTVEDKIAAVERYAEDVMAKVNP